MGDIELLECMIETEINKLKYQQRIAIRNGQANKIKATAIAAYSHDKARKVSYPPITESMV